jgi:acetyltransferase-like isoleucine patch superfamily enzyme
MRIVDRLLGRWDRFQQRLQCARLRELCDAAADAEIAPQAVIRNSLGKQAVCIGSQTLFMGEISVTPPGGRVDIGEWCFVGPASKIWAMEKLSIGSRVFISHGVQIFDNNSHSLAAAERHDRFRELRTLGRHLQPETVARKPVQIEDDVWIGFNAAILKGVKIGRGAVVGACAVVVDDVPEYTIVAGNPARAVGKSCP